MISNAIKKANELLNDNSLKIISYAENDNFYLFEYISCDDDLIFDNCLIKVDKKTIEASYYIITEHFKEIKELNFKELDAK